MLKRIVLCFLAILGIYSNAWSATLKINNLTKIGADTRENTAIFTINESNYVICAQGPGQPPCPSKQVISVPDNQEIHFKLQSYYLYHVNLLIDKSCEKNMVLKPDETQSIEILPDALIGSNTIIYCRYTNMPHNLLCR